MENPLDGLNTGFEKAEEKNQQSLNRSIEIIQSEEQKKRERMKKNEQSLRVLWDTCEYSNVSIIIVSEGEGRGRKNI